MSWKEIYENRKCTADEAVRLIKSNDRVILGHCICEPTALVDAMVANYEQYKNVTVAHMVSLGKGEYAKAEYKENFRWEGFFCGAGTRNAVAEGHGDLIPVYFQDVPRWIRNGILNYDVCMVTVSPPNKAGYCSLGVESGYTYQAVKSATIVLAQVNNYMPETFGDTFFHVSEIDKFVEMDMPLVESQPSVIGDVEKAIGKHCASLIEDGATLQLGIGAIPDAVLAELKHKKHLGIHSEMIADGVVDLVEAGVIDCSEKTLHNGKMIVTFLMGTKKLYDFADNNPMLQLRPVDYVNDPVVIAQNNKMVSINSALQVDFMGQVVACSIGKKQFSGVGGQVDFVRGTAMSQDGKGISIIAMPSVTVKKDGTIISKITPYIDHGAAVTTNRYDVDYIITEYGIARMRGKNLKERARALINIAHPDLRGKLKEEFEDRFNVAY
ncbi:MAG: acetyl-CoA hydrolase/transferase C-terminal domain-containing protein [Eubacteriales bacterium]|nr:acetyl-CoA hydrolase/transferase C-terminal domain-containing protein [Eubacteriales bacterium]